jgi:hypothetical protein
MEKERIKFTKKEVKDFLDRRIDYWNKRFKSDTSLSKNAMAVCFMDAYKDVKHAIFGDINK